MGCDRSSHVVEPTWNVLPSSLHQLPREEPFVTPFPSPSARSLTSPAALPPQEDAPMPDAAGDGEEARTELENELYGSTSLNDLLGLAMIGGQLAGVRDEEEGMIQVGSGEKRGYEG